MRWFNPEWKDAQVSTQINESTPAGMVASARMGLLEKRATPEPNEKKRQQRRSGMAEREAATAANRRLKLGVFDVTRGTIVSSSVSPTSR